MKLLVLGGTEFVGRAFVDEAIATSWDVTVFNRGKNQSRPGVVALQGDRTEQGGLDALADGQWDVVVDTWSRAPIAVHEAAQLLRDRVRRYVYVSSRSVYRDPVPAGANEDGPIVVNDPQDNMFDDYARAKAGAESAVSAQFGERALIIRPGLILGPHENVGRLPWWLNAVADGGRVLAPGPEGNPLQYIDARDLAAWGLSAAARRSGGAFDAVSESGHATMSDLLRACVEVTGSTADLVWMEPNAIADAGLEPWTDVPIWIPPGPDHDRMHGSDVSKACAAGLHCRPVGETVADTWSWLVSRGRLAPRRADRPVVGISRAAMSALLSDA